MPDVFVNYRTGDAEFAATLIDRALSDQFGEHRVFLAPKSIPPGQDFQREILGSVRECSVLLAVVGPNWLTLADSAGRRRIDDPDDWVHREIAEAYRHDVTVVPVLIDETERLTKAHLPADIAALATAQFRRLDHRNAIADLAGLADTLRGIAPSLARKESEPLPVATESRFEQSWRGGEKIHLGGSDYLLNDGVVETMAPDRSWTFRRADAYRLGSQPDVVRLRQVDVLRDTDAARRPAAAMLRQAELAPSLRGLPILLATIRDPGGVTLVFKGAPGRSVRDVYGPTIWPLEHFRTKHFLRTLVDLCLLLTKLHQRGFGHGDLGPDAVTVAGDGVHLRDLGLPSPVDTSVDVYQVAKLGYHVLTGHPPGPGGTPPPSATDPRLPRDLLAAALSADPAARPSAEELAAQLNGLSAVLR